MKEKKKKGGRIALIVIVVLVLALVLAGYLVMKTYLGQIGRTYDDPVQTVAPEDEFFEVDVTPEPTPAGEPEAPVVDEPAEVVPDDVEWSFIDSIEDDHLINIMLVGQDRREGQGRQRSDSMILFSVNPETGETALISFLRDTYVQIPGGYSDNRLNMAYQFGGFELLDETLSVNFGLSIDGNFEVDFSGFEAIINMIGGVDIELTAAEAAYLVKASGVPGSAVEGMNNLDGLYARMHAQNRSIGNDFGRSGRQRQVLLAVFDKVKGLPASELLALMYDALPYLTTDLTDGEILSLVSRLLPLITSVQVETHMVPNHDCYTAAKIRNMSVLVPDLERIRRYLEEEYLPLH